MPSGLKVGAGGNASAKARLRIRKLFMVSELRICGITNQRDSESVGGVVLERVE